MAKFVPGVVRDVIEKNPYMKLKKREKDVSVLILDIQGCTTLCENLSYVDMNYIIERYFSAFFDEINRYHGDVNETMGDGLMAIYQGKGKIENALNAARSALAISETTHRLNQELEGKFDPIVINMGISSGIAAVGVTKFTGRTGERWTYTASGPITNLSSRLCSAAEEGAILADEDTAKRIDRHIEIKELGKRKFKDVGTLVRVFMPIRELSANQSPTDKNPYKKQKGPGNERRDSRARPCA
jgi:class 3 adenylate cyclase